ncbi:hypothetical protein ACJX0J_019493 [Zea mays]
MLTKTVNDNKQSNLGGSLDWNEKGRKRKKKEQSKPILDVRLKYDDDGGRTAFMKGRLGEVGIILKLDFEKAYDKRFLTVRVKVNNQLGKYIISYKGLGE